MRKERLRGTQAFCPTARGGPGAGETSPNTRQHPASRSALFGKQLPILGWLCDQKMVPGALAPSVVFWVGNGRKRESKMAPIKIFPRSLPPPVISQVPTPPEMEPGGVAYWLDTGLALTVKGF